MVSNVCIYLVYHCSLQSVIGFVDVIDILTYVVSTISEGRTVEEAQWRLPTLKLALAQGLSC